MSVQSVTIRDDNWSNIKLNEVLRDRGNKVLFWNRYMLGGEFDYTDYFDIKMLLRLSCSCFDKYKNERYKQISKL